jgi:RNA polymerase sigma-70 factor (ECF subfamily)
LLTAEKPAIDDQALLARLLAGDKAAFAGLVREHHSALVRMARVFVSTQASAEELVQETWIAVLDGLKTFEGRSSLRTWIFRILTNRAKTRSVREGRSTPLSALGPPETDEPAVDPARFLPDGHWADPPHSWQEEDPERIALRGEAIGCVERAIAALPANQRAVITLRDVEGVPSDEVCTALEISEGNQRVLLHRARARVRTALEQFWDEEKKR